MIINSVIGGSGVVTGSTGPLDLNSESITFSVGFNPNNFVFYGICTASNYGDCSIVSGYKTDSTHFLYGTADAEYSADHTGPLSYSNGNITLTRNQSGLFMKYWTYYFVAWN